MEAPPGTRPRGAPEAAPDAAQDDRPRLALPVGPRDHARGPEDAPVTLVEYGDFECPQCRQAYPVVAELHERLGDRLRFVYRHFPLTNVHPHAQRAAETAEWAAAAGAFWPLHDLMLRGDQKLGDGDLQALARELGLDADALPEAWAAHTYFGRVKEDFLSGVKSEVKGTPSFFINGVRHTGAWELDTLERALQLAARQRSG